MRSPIRDVRCALRTLRRAPLFSALAPAMLALGIGANTAVFSVIEGVLLRPPPVTGLDRLAVVWETGGGVEIAWALRDGALELTVDDEGPGLAGSANLFTPFFTTKPGGSGIGLVLSRQIAEGHGGSLVLEPREGRGARARLRLPLAPA